MDSAADAAATRRGAWVLDAGIALLLVAVLALPFAAMAAAGVPDDNAAALPVAVDLPALVRAPTAPLRDVPIYTRGSFVDEAADANAFTDPAAMAVILRRGGDLAFAGADPVDMAEFWRVLGLHDGDFFGSELGDQAYPFRFAVVETVLGRLLPNGMAASRARAANDLAALLILTAAHQQPDDAPEFGKAASVAYAVLDRLRQHENSCDVQLNLAFLISTDGVAEDEWIDEEFERAVRACPNDPTALWLHGEVQVQRSYAIPGEGTLLEMPSAERLARPFDTFLRLQQDFPGAAAGWAGEANAEVRLAENATENGAMPFVARHRFGRALVLYERADQLSDDPGIDIGLARSLAGLGRYEEAAEAAERALNQVPTSGQFQRYRTEYLQRAGRYAQAAAEAEPLLAEPLAGPNPTALSSAGSFFLRNEPISIGIERKLPVDLLVGPRAAGAGANVYDLGFVPTFRDDELLTRHVLLCRQWTYARNLILAGSPDLAMVAASQVGIGDGYDARSECKTSDEFSEVDGFDVLSMIAAAERDGIEAGAEESLVEHVYDSRQNLWRFAGDLAHAASIVDEWIRRAPRSALAAERAGEIAFLRGDYAVAEARFADAATHYGQSRSALDRLGRAEALLKQGAAQAFVGSDAAAVQTLVDAERAGVAAARALEDSESSGEAYRGTLVGYYSHLQRGDIALRTQQYEVAAASYAAAIELYPSFDDFDTKGEWPGWLKNGAAENNLALAQIMLGDGAKAVRTARVAISRDSRSPIFVQTLAYAYQEAGNVDAAIETYRTALAADATLFPAANDLGVLLAATGRTGEALAEFRRAVAVEPDFAIGWFNLGVLLSRMGPAEFLPSQGALGRAAALDAAFRDRERELVYDKEPYFSGLDLSRPLPAGWTFAETERRAPAAITAVVVLLLIGRFAWGLGLDQAAGKVSERVLGRVRRERWLGAARRPWAAAVAIVATLGLFLYSMLTSARPSLVETVVISLGVLTLIGLYLRSRAILARRHGERTHHFTWPPALALGVALTAFGLAFAPIPATVPPRRPALRWIAPAALAAAAGALLFLGWYSGVPATRALGVSALVMVGSVLVPARPLDGAYLTNNVASILVTLAMVGASVLLLLGWV